jgi:8-oxo-dGTP pyrophosphatase MutT (NUDIX family)
VLGFNTGTGVAARRYRCVMSKSKKRAKQKKKQVGALPVRRNKRGKAEVLLVTTRGKFGSWIIPKGNGSKRLRDKDAAAREASEEGGVSGHLRSRPMGMFTHRKRNGKVKKIKVFRLDVKRVEREWPEKKQRKRLWTSPRRAKRLVRAPKLRRIIEQT